MKKCIHGYNRNVIVRGYGAKPYTIASIFSRLGFDVRVEYADSNSVVFNGLTYRFEDVSYIVGLLLQKCRGEDDD